MDTETETYRKEWKRQKPNIPYGFCWCGCGKRTRIASRKITCRGHIKGEPLKWILGHNERRGTILDSRAYRHEWEVERPEIPYGKCWCGCGNDTPVAPQSHAGKGYVEGEPKKWCIGHSTRQPYQTRYTVENQGYDTPCWIWQGAVRNRTPDHLGYGHIKVGKKAKSAHRVFYEDRYGAIPNGNELHHRCRQSLCVNPDHLQPLSKSDHFGIHVHEISAKGLAARWGGR